ncbi:MAG: hypothetical protein J2P49_03895 [Methylocapsa sp.]|nr:hypothetical protein [Methylocapsa sp.]
MTLTLAIIGSALLGACLARCFKVLILVPVSAVLLLGLTAKAYCFEQGFLTLAAQSAVLVTSMQIGYAAIPIFIVARMMPRKIGTRWRHMG